MGPDYFSPELDFLRLAPIQFDCYIPPCDCVRETKARPSAHIADWRTNAQDMSGRFSAVRGADSFQGMLLAVGDLMSLHVRGRVSIHCGLFAGPGGGSQSSDDTANARVGRRDPVVCESREADVGSA